MKRALGVAVWFVLSGCVVEVEDGPAPALADAEDDRILVVHDGALRDVFTNNIADGWLHGPELSVPPDANRVGLQFDADGVFAVACFGANEN